MEVDFKELESRFNDGKKTSIEVETAEWYDID
jgi:hypothetical protein